MTLRHYCELLAGIEPQFLAHVTTAVKCIIENVAAWNPIRCEDDLLRPKLDHALTWGDGADRVELTPIAVTGENLLKIGMPPRALKSLGAPESRSRIPKSLRIENCAEITFGERCLWGFGQTGVIIDLSGPSIIYHRYTARDFNPPSWFKP